YSTAIKVFDERGRFITLVGGEGTGPGEFGGIATVHHGAGDTLHILDSSNSRGSVISPSYEFNRSYPLEIRPEKDGAIRLADGRFVLASPVRSAALEGQVLHLLDTTGRRVRSFGANADPGLSAASTVRLGRVHTN